MKDKQILERGIIMKDKQILEMLKEIVTEVDYDIYKEIFSEDGEDTQKTLVDIVKKHIKSITPPTRGGACS